MWFGQLPSEQCIGCVLAHSIRTEARRVPKGTLLDQQLVQELIDHDYSHLTVARFDADDVSENKAAHQLATAACGAGVRTEKAHTGRVNIYAAEDGHLNYNADAVINANSVIEDITLSVLTSDQWVLAGRMVASAKIIPYAVAKMDLERAVGYLGASNLQVIKPEPSTAVLIQTTLPSVKATTLDKTALITESRLQFRSINLLNEFRCEHNTDALVECIRQAENLNPDTILIVGASAISDRRDVLPAAVVACGGSVRRVGLPVDPGNLLMLADYNNMTVLGLPGCARSPKTNGLDLLLDKLACNLDITDQWLNSLCIGGLLDEVHDRPQPRVGARVGAKVGANDELVGDVALIDTSDTATPGIAALILAAGSSRRAGENNKLLHQYDGAELLCSVVQSVQGSAVASSLVVTGHQADKVEQAVAPYGIDTCYCPGYAGGMAHSIASGISRLQNYDGVIVCLGDMPHVSTELIDQIIAAGKGNVVDKIVIPVFKGQRGNPVMIGRTFFDSLLQSEGDTGARYLIKQYPEKIVEVEVGSDAVLQDYDTAESLNKLDNQL